VVVRRPTLMKTYSHPPKGLFGRMRDSSYCNHDITIVADQHGNISLYVPGNENSLAPYQLELIRALERAAGWPSTPAPGEAVFKTTRTSQTTTPSTKRSKAHGRP
jgi:hypothetical protein